MSSTKKTSYFIGLFPPEKYMRLILTVLMLFKNTDWDAEAGIDTWVCLSNQTQQSQYFSVSMKQ